MSASASRRVAREGVTRVRERSAYAHETMDGLLSASALEARDAAFASRLAYGTIACRGTLDEAVRAQLKDPSGLEPLVGDCLAASTYELLFMRTPKRAAVNEGVELVKAIRPRAASLANAVLRRIAEAAQTFPWGDPATDVAVLARLHGHPLWLAERLVSELGRQTATAVMAANNEPAPLYLAHLPFRSDMSTVIGALQAEGADPVVCAQSGCIEARDSRAAVMSSPLREGSVIVMDAGAQLVASSVPLSSGSTVCDMGAGRGGKTLAIAGRALTEGLSVSVVAVDVHAAKLEVLQGTAERCGAPHITTVVADVMADIPGASLRPESMDAVLVDAPCSGLGTLRRHPDRRWRMNESEIADLAALGRRMLEAAASLVKPGGFVVYSTCTIVAEENDHVVDGFLASAAGGGFVEVGVREAVPDEWSGFVAPNGRFRSLPAHGGPDGHFVTRLVREG